MSDPTRLKNNIKVNRLLRRRCHSTRARRNLSVDRLLEADDTQSSPQALETIWRQAALILNAPGGRVPPIVPGGSTPRGRWRSSSKAQFSLLLKHARTQPQNDWWIYHGFPKRLQHVVRHWVEPGALFHICVALDREKKQRLFTEPVLALRLLDSAKFYEDQQR